MGATIGLTLHAGQKFILFVFFGSRDGEIHKESLALELPTRMHTLRMHHPNPPCAHFDCTQHATRRPLAMELSSGVKERVAGSPQPQCTRLFFRSMAETVFARHAFRSPCQTPISMTSATVEPLADDFSEPSVKSSRLLSFGLSFWVLFAYLLSSQSLWLSLLPAATAADRCSFARSLRT